MNNYTIYLDIETTGFSTQYCEIIEIAAIALDNGVEVDRFHEYCKPKKGVPAKITELTGITNGMVVNKRPEKDVLMDFIEWFTILAPSTIVGHNCKSFDLRFIRERSEGYGLQFNHSLCEIVDTLVVARALRKQGKIEVENCKQPTLASFYGIEYEAHSAINDVEALILLNSKMSEKTNKPNRTLLGF